MRIQNNVCMHRNMVQSLRQGILMLGRLKRLSTLYFVSTSLEMDDGASLRIWFVADTKID